MAESYIVDLLLFSDPEEGARAAPTIPDVVFVVFEEDLSVEP
jgi:hypothetical protein